MTSALLVLITGLLLACWWELRLIRTSGKPLPLRRPRKRPRKL